MAAPTDTGYGLGVKESGKTVDIDDVDRQGPELVSGLSARDVVGSEEKNGSDACPEGVQSDDHGEEQVAKKPRVEKAENGGTEKPDDSGYGVESVEGIVDKDDTEHEGQNGTAEVEGEGEDSGNGVVGAVEDEPAKDAVTGKDAAPGDVGLRTLLQEGDNTKTSVANHGADATHMLDGAK